MSELTLPRMPARRALLVSAISMSMLALLFSIFAYAMQRKADNAADDQRAVSNLREADGAELDQIETPCLTSFGNAAAGPGQVGFVDTQSVLNPRIDGITGEGAVVVNALYDNSVQIGFNTAFPRPVPEAGSVFLRAIAVGSGSLAGAPVWHGVLANSRTFRLSARFTVSALQTVTLGSGQGHFRAFFPFDLLGAETSMQTMVTSTDEHQPTGVRFKADFVLGELDLQMWTDTPIVLFPPITFNVISLFPIAP